MFTVYSVQWEKRRLCKDHLNFFVSSPASWNTMCQVTWLSVHLQTNEVWGSSSAGNLDIFYTQINFHNKVWYNSLLQIMVKFYMYTIYYLLE